MAVSANGRVTTDALIALIERHTGRNGRRTGRETVLLCPSHEGPDSTPSLNVRDGDGGYPLIQCRSQGCSAEQVLEAVGLSWSDVFGNDSEHWTPSGEPWIEVYDYVGPDGELRYQVCRTASKEFAQRQPDSSKPHGWAWNLRGVERVPFRLPQVLEAIREGIPVWLADGEKDVKALERAGVVATCSSGGALKWPAAFTDYFRGAHVRLVVDWDPAVNSAGKPHAEGQRAALAIHAKLAPVAESFELYRARDGKDAHDHLEHHGHALHDMVAVTVEELRAFVAEAGTPAAEAAAEAPPAAGGDEEYTPRLRFLAGEAFVDQVLGKTEPLLGDGKDALMMPGSLMLLAGIGGAGKTTLSLHMLAHWAAGLPWFGITVSRPIRCVVIENEGPHDPYVQKVREFAQRFEGCTCSGEPHGSGREFLANCLFMDYPWGHFSFGEPRLAEELRETVVGFDGDLVIANPLNRLGMKGAGTPEETREFLQLLTNAGLGEDFAALLLHHLAKVNKNVPLVQQVSGDWGPHPDTIMVLEAAGERRTKLSFGKVRWGDQGRAPLILNWLTDPNGPVGYKVADAPAGVSESEMFERIDAFLREQSQPVGITAIAKGVTGQNKRKREIVERGVAQGRYATSGGARPTYWLLVDDSTTVGHMQPELGADE